MTRMHAKRRRLSCGNREKMLASISRRDLLRTPLQRSTCWISSDVAVVALMPVIARWESPLSPTASLVLRLPSQERAQECWYVPVAPSRYAKVGAAAEQYVAAAMATDPPAPFE